MDAIPNEFVLSGVFMPPLLVASVLGFVLAVVTSSLLDRVRLSRFFFYPPLAFIALTVLYVCAIGTFVIRV